MAGELSKLCDELERETRYLNDGFVCAIDVTQLRKLLAAARELEALRAKLEPLPAKWRARWSDYRPASLVATEPNMVWDYSPEATELEAELAGGKCGG